MKNIIIICGLLIGINILNGQNKLIIPDILTGSTFHLTLQNGTHQFYDGTNTTTMGVNGGILGPTLILNQGENVDITVENQLSDTTTIHWHGMHVSAENDGGPHTTIPPNDSWNPQFKVLDKASTYWYHPHLHEKTNLHVTMGLAGVIIVRDSEEAALNLPRTYAVDDFPLVIQTKNIDINGQIVFPSNTDSVVMVNATIDAELEVPAQVVRLRLLNGSSQRVFNLGLSNAIEFYQIGSDGGLLEKPIALNRLRLASGERAEILADLSGMEGQTIRLMSYAAELPNGIYGASNPGIGNGPGMTLDGYYPNPLNGNDFNIMQFKVIDSGTNPVRSIPSVLAVVIPYAEIESDTTRNFFLSPAGMGPNILNGGFLINGQLFDINVINHEIQLNNTEIWSIRNMSPTGHPFHIHDVQFYILDRDGDLPPLNERGRKDVAFIEPFETIRFITKFEDFANDPVPYMYHCHMLTHEDDGMMGQFKVVASNLGTDNENSLILPKAISIQSIYPNPFNPQVKIRYAISQNSNIRIHIYDLQGKLINDLFEGQQQNGEHSINWAGTNNSGQDVPSGIYFVEISTKNFLTTRKLTLLR